MYSDVFPAFQRIQSTGDVLTDLTGRNISDYLVKTYTNLIRTRYYGPFVTNDSLTCSYVSRNSSYLCFCCTAWRASTGWMNRGMGVLNISRKYNDSTLWTLREHMHAFCDKYEERWRSLFFRYGGISVGGLLPVLDVDPKTIQNAAAQLGRLLNVTGVTVMVVFIVNWCNQSKNYFPFL